MASTQIYFSGGAKDGGAEGPPEQGAKCQSTEGYGSCVCGVTPPAQCGSPRGMCEIFHAQLYIMVLLVSFVNFVFWGRDGGAEREEAKYTVFPLFLSGLVTVLTVGSMPLVNA